MTWVADGIHRNRDGHVVPHDAVVPALRGKGGVLHIGIRATVQGAIHHEGAVIMAAGARVQGDIAAGHEVVIGARAAVGRIRCNGRIVVEEGATTGRLEAGGEVHLLGACTVGDVQAGGDIIVVGAPRTGQLSPGGRITTRPW